MLFSFDSIEKPDNSEFDMKRLLWIVLLSFAVVSGFAVAKDAPRSPTAWEFSNAKDYESDYPGLGYGESYRSANGVASVYVYTMQHAWADGITDAKLLEELESTIKEVRAAERLGRYQELRVGESKVVTINGQEFLRIFMTYKFDGDPFFSPTYLTGRKGHLVKYRISLRLPEAAAVDEAEKFIEEDFPQRSVKFNGSRVL